MELLLEYDEKVKLAVEYAVLVEPSMYLFPLNHEIWAG